MDSQNSVGAAQSPDALAYLHAGRLRVEGALAHYLPQADSPAGTLAEAMRYAVLAGGGKRLRPVLCLATAEALGAEPDSVLPAACAIELIHTFSLVHDDLPALDDDVLRRNLPTCHVAYGEAVALLAGDALLVLAFEVLLDQLRFSPPAPVLEVMKLLTQASGPDGLAGGQVADILAEGRAIDVATLDFIHTRKTGALIKAAVMTGALLGGGSESLVQRMGAYGAEIGHAFQIVDDLLNETGDPARLGKAVGSDRQRGKATYPSLYSLDACRELANAKLDRALGLLSPLGDKGAVLRVIARHVVHRDH